MGNVESGANLHIGRDLLLREPDGTLTPIGPAPEATAEQARRLSIAVEGLVEPGTATVRVSSDRGASVHSAAASPYVRVPPWMFGNTCSGEVFSVEIRVLGAKRVLARGFTVQIRE